MPKQVRHDIQYMNIFNSLGSNYNLGFVIKALFANNKKEDSSKLIKLLEEKYGGKTVLTYKGRDALRLALRIINKPKDYTVGVCGFTCFAVWETIVKEGYRVEYLDIEKDLLNFSLETLKRKYKKNPKLKIIFIQNTLGYACDMEGISKFCKENNIILVEDLAHSIGTKYSNGKEAGIVGDFAAFSFSQDKMIDGVSGGALIVRNDKFPISNFQFPIPNKRTQNIDKMYPTLTFLIRKTYGLGIGKAFHYFLKRADLLSKPVENSNKDDLRYLSFWYCKLIYHEFLELENNIQHRRKIADIYAKELNYKILFKKLVSQVLFSSNLRFPIFVDNRQDLVQFLKKYNIYISDIWYDAPIAPKKYLDRTNYKVGDCTNSEVVSKTILNLPTHKNISEKDAKYISHKINLWLKLQ